jgi:4-hydroxyphenylpyruvate dioxygenase-like putative hemolysin
MTSRLSIATVCLSGTLADKLDAAAAAGFDGIEIFESDLLASSWSPSRLARESAVRGLSIDLFQPLADDRRFIGRQLELLEQLGARTMLVTSATAGDLAGEDAAAAELHALASRAERHGVRLAYEAVPWARFTRDHARAWAIVRRAGHPALGLCLDSFHVLAGGDDPAGVESIPGARVFHVRLADAPHVPGDLRVASRHHRLFPGLGALDLAEFVAHVRRTGYRGPLSLEVANDVYRQMDPWQAAIDGKRAMLALGDRMTEAPGLGGYAFVELAVDETSGPAVAAALGALGFVHGGQHRSKPVQLWQQGDARVLLNFAPPTSTAPATAAICALGVESGAPARSARRAQQLLAPALPRVRGADEADLNTVAAPDGTTVLFCRSSGDDAWTGDFEATGRPAAQAWATGVDHIALTESVDDFDQTALFYRCVLGLRAGAPIELAAPFGLIHSRAAADPDATVRIVLNAATLRRGGWAPGIPNPQHIAVGTADAIATAAALRERNAPILSIPGNYYDYLGARFDLPPERLAALRSNNVLYDRDDLGEYLHFYTAMLGSRVFVEVVQRTGGYRGYGDPHGVPVRMAAHRDQRLAGLRSHRSAPERHDYSLAHLTALSLPPPDLVDAAADAGYRFVGLRLTRVTPQEPHYPLASDPALLRATKVRLAATGVDVLDIELARLGPHDDPRDLQRVLEAGAELGARHIITQLPDPDPARKVDNFATLCEMARPLGLTADLEFPSWTQTPDLHEAVRVLRAAGQPNAGILVDLLHFARSGSAVDELHDLPAEWFHFVHVCDALAAVPPTEEGLIHTARFERLFPGDGGIDVQGILAALPAGIPYALEIPRAMSVSSVGPKEHARMSLAAARRHLDV